MNPEKTSTQKILVAIGCAISAALMVALLFHALDWNARGLAIFPLAAAGSAAWFIVKKSGIQ